MHTNSEAIIVIIGNISGAQTNHSVMLVTHEGRTEAVLNSAVFKRTRYQNSIDLSRRVIKFQYCNVILY